MKSQLNRLQATIPDAATPETELVSAARAGSEAAVRELIRRLNPRLFRVARGIVASDIEAEDVVQDTYLAAFAKLESFREEASFETWITVKTRLFRARLLLRASLERKLRGGFEEIFPFDGKRCTDMADRVVSKLKAEGAL